jgi:hypothetical protein
VAGPGANAVGILADDLCMLVARIDKTAHWLARRPVARSDNQGPESKRRSVKRIGGYEIDIGSANC